MQEKIKSLQRRLQRNIVMPEFVNSISAISNFEIKEAMFLSQEEIDLHNIKLNSTDFKFNYLNLSFPTEKVSMLKTRLCKLSYELDKENYLSLSHLADLFALKTITAFISEKFQELLDLDRGLIHVYTTDYTNGLWIDQYNDYWFLDGKTEFVSIIELRVFGEAWIKKVMAFHE